MIFEMKVTGRDASNVEAKQAARGMR
uniref:Uncharacterized protein n=1 Tax=Rhizophora mucronata TaxID=61149 RepID=A0A2P2NNW4_RHIMU